MKVVEHTDTTHWRLVRSAAARGAENMAVDDAVLQAVCENKSPCTLRVYAWQPPCLSLGYAQPFHDLDISRLDELGWDVVRRPTGGRAILHTDELTYALIAPDSHPAFSGGVLASYRKLSAALVRALENLGLDVDVSPDTALPEEQRREPVCFQSPSAYEITVRGKKIVGSAQLRRRGAVLQHGSIPLSGDITRICRVLKYDDEAARREAVYGVRMRSATVEDILQTPVIWETAVRALTQGFEQALGWEFSEGNLSPLELKTSRALIESRYDSQEWTRRM
jgi:lipoyl(octanoyl) transferase